MVNGRRLSTAARAIRARARTRRLPSVTVEGGRITRGRVRTPAQVRTEPVQAVPLPVKRKIPTTAQKITGTGRPLPRGFSRRDTEQFMGSRMARGTIVRGTIPQASLAEQRRLLGRVMEAESIQRTRRIKFI